MSEWTNEEGRVSESDECCRDGSFCCYGKSLRSSIQRGLDKIDMG